MQPKLSSLRQRCRAWLTRTTALIALCGFSAGGALPAGAQMLDNTAPPPAVVSDGGNGYWAFENDVGVALAANSGRNLVWMGIGQTGNGTGTIGGEIDGRYAGACPYSASLLCTQYMPAGPHIKIKATPDAQSIFTGWASGPCEGTRINPCSFILNEDFAAIAHFETNSIVDSLALEVGLLREWQRDNFDFSPITGLGFGAVKIEVMSSSGRQEKSCSSVSTTSCRWSFESRHSAPEITVQATPSQGSIFGGWFHGPCKGSKSNTCTFNLTEHTVVVPIFHEKTTAISTTPLTLSIYGMGSISGPRPKSDGSFDLSNELLIESDTAYSSVPQSFYYQSGSEVSLQVKPKEGWYFVGWGGDCLGMANCTLTMNANKSVVANFSLTYSPPDDNDTDEKITIGIRKVGSGIGWVSENFKTDEDAFYESVICDRFSTYCSVNREYNPSTKLIATAAEGSVFVGWESAIGGCTGNNPMCGEPLKSVDGIIAMIAIFDRKPSSVETTCQARHFTDIEEKVQDAYIAFYGRPADLGGLASWSNELDKAGGDISAIMDAFGNSDEYRDRFSDMTNRELINNLYMQLFARPGDSEGLDWYEDQMRQGKATLASIALDIAGGAQKGGSDWNVLEGRRKVARHYITIIESQSGGNTKMVLADYLAAAHEGNADAVCEALSQALFR